MGKKIFYIDIDEAQGMDAISLVSYPAVEYNFLCFDEQKKKVLQFANEDKHIISGVVALADTPIYRYDNYNGEYWVIFTKETIEKMVEKYSKNNLWNSINLQHKDDTFVDSVIMLESYIKDSSRGIVPKEFAEIPDGSWICSFKVEDEKLWDEIKNGDILNGFSLQGFFDLKPEPEPIEENEEDEIIKLLKEILN